jgi:hypothetical protein
MEVRYKTYDYIGKYINNNNAYISLKMNITSTHVANMIRYCM